jgi:hypothetical protein
MKLKSKTRLGVIVSVLLAANAHALSATRTLVSEIKPLLIRALEHGEARGVLTGESAAYMNQKFGATAPLEIDVKRLHALPQPGCSRLQVITRQQQVLIKGQREDQTLTYQINYCRDGGFPAQR